MPKEYTQCVKSEMAAGKSKKDAQKICAIAYYKRHGRSHKKDENLSFEEYLEEYGLLKDVEEYVKEHLIFDETLIKFNDFELAAKETWKAPTARKEVPDSHFFWVKKSKTGKGKIKKFPYKNKDGTINCAAVIAVIRTIRGARSGKDLTKKYPGVLQKAQGIWNSHCKKTIVRKQGDYTMPKFTNNYITVVKLGEKGAAIEPMTIEILRTGKFKHPWFGTLTFNKSKLDAMVKNFDDNVIGRDISFDICHIPDKGAVAWCQKLFVEEREDGVHVLKAVIEPTDYGKNKLKGKRYIYFSTEYTEEFRDKENDHNFGPTVLGGGFTNRPFIPNLAPIALSEEVIEELQAEGDGELKINLKDYQFEEEVDDADDDLDDSDDADDDLDDSDDDLDDSDDDADDDIDNKDTKNNKFKGDDSGGRKMGKKTAINNKSVTAEELAKKLQELEKVNTDLSSDKEKLAGHVKTLLTEVEKLQSSVKVLNEKAETSSKKEFEAVKMNLLKELGDKGVAPSVVKFIEAKIIYGQDNIKLSDDKEQSIMEFIKELFENMPENMFIPLDEQKTEKTGESDEDEKYFSTDAIRDSLIAMQVPVKDEPGSKKKPGTDDNNE